MSQLGNIYNSYGQQINIAVANTYSYNVASGVNLSRNTVIISSNVDEDGNDTGTYSLFVTDNNGSPIRLTYNISQGNGLYYSQDGDYLSLYIDNDTLISDNNQLKFNINNHLGESFSYEGNKIELNELIIPNSSLQEFGISSIDGETINSDDDTIYVNTQALKYSNNSTSTYGIAIGDGKTIITQNGKLLVNIESFNKASSDNLGFIKGDNSTVDINDGVISVITNKLNLGNSEQYGIGKPDMNTIIFNSDRQITVNEDNLKIATSSTYGLSKINTDTISLNNDKISMKDYDFIKKSISEYKNIYYEYKNEISKIKELLISGNTLVKDKDIQLFSINETSATELNKPQDNEEVIKMPIQYVSVMFNIITTCDFIMNIHFEEGTNEFPNVDIVEVNYNDEKIYTREEALDPKTIYSSTEGELKKFIVKLSAKNFRNSKKGKSLITSINFIISNSEDHNRQKNEKYSIIRYNSLYKEEKQEQEVKDDSLSNRNYILKSDEIYWSFI